MKILVVEDDPKMQKLLHRGLSEEGHQIDTCNNGTQTLEQVRHIDYDVIVLDWMLPDTDGLNVLRKLREQGLHTPVLMLTARAQVGERVAGLQAGADDYLVKPFAFEELLARLDALYRRRNSAWTVNLGSVTFDSHRRTIAHANEEAQLTAREFQMLRTFIEHVGEVLTRSELLQRVWGPNFDGEPNIVDVYVSYLRGKLESIGAVGIQLKTVRGMGYRLEIFDKV